MVIIIKSSNFSKFSCSKYYGQILFYLVFSKLMELHCDMLTTNLITWYLTSDYCIRKRKNSNSKTYLLNFLSVTEDIHILLITVFSYLFILFFSWYSAFSVILFGCFSCMSTFSLWEISSFFIGCVTNRCTIRFVSTNSWHLWWEEITGVKFFD